MKLARSRGIVAISALVLIFICAGLVYAQFAAPEDAITYRKSVMLLTAHHFKSLGGALNSKGELQKDKVAHDANAVRFLATLPWEAMLVDGSDQGKTTMSKAVFEKREQFDKEIAAFQTSTQQLATAAATGERDQIKKVFGTVAGSCKSCHRRFRK